MFSRRVRTVALQRDDRRLGTSNRQAVIVTSAKRKRIVNYTVRFLFGLAFLLLIHLASQYRPELSDNSSGNNNNKYEAVNLPSSTVNQETPATNININPLVEQKRQDTDRAPKTSIERGGVKSSATKVQIRDHPVRTTVGELRYVESSTTNKKQLSLRFDWTNLEPRIDLTQRMVAHQANCSAPLGTFVYRNRFGLGSDLHIWGQALCNGIAINMRIRTVGNWTWVDQKHCGHLPSPMLCYFQHAELTCPNDHSIAAQHPEFDQDHNLSRSNGVVVDLCQSIYQGMKKRRLRMAGLEYLFTRVSPLLLEEATRQLNLVFRGENQIPKGLITVHIRWGDKEREMLLVSIAKYIQAVTEIVSKRGDENENKTHVFLATEDPKALNEFMEQAPKDWHIYVDQYYHDMLPHRVTEYNGSPKMSKALDGRAGLVALGSLLVAMEANDFVLTTASNWSRLMNELRKAIVDPRCNNCTSMVDLRAVKNEW